MKPKKENTSLKIGKLYKVIEIPDLTLGQLVSLPQWPCYTIKWHMTKHDIYPDWVDFHDHHRSYLKQGNLAMCQWFENAPGNQARYYSSLNMGDVVMLLGTGESPKGYSTVFSQARADGGTADSYIRLLKTGIYDCYMNTKRLVDHGFKLELLK